MTKKYTVKTGDCISSISARHGLFWETVWNDSKNSELKKLRQDPNTLANGDVVNIPDIEPKQESCSVEQKHSFTVKGVPAKMKFKFLLEDEPFANAPFSLMIDDEFSEEGQSDGGGFIKVSIPPTAKSCKVTLGEPEDQHIFNLTLGLLAPNDTDDGAMERLFNLGFGAAKNKSDAIKQFQQQYDLKETATLDDATRSKINEVSGQ